MSTIKQHGFAILETLIITICVVAVIGTGIYVYEHRDTVAPTESKDVTAQIGTTARTDQLNTQEMDEEAGIEKTNDASRQSALTIDNSALGNMAEVDSGNDL
jgi:hypothetical protein